MQIAYIVKPNRKAVNCNLIEFTSFFIISSGKNLSLRYRVMTVIRQIARRSKFLAKLIMITQRVVLLQGMKKMVRNMPKYIVMSTSMAQLQILMFRRAFSYVDLNSSGNSKDSDQSIWYMVAEQRARSARKIVYEMSKIT